MCENHRDALRAIACGFACGQLLSTNWLAAILFGSVYVATILAPPSRNRGHQ